MNISDGINQILQKRVSKGMTLIEMLCFIALVVCVVEGVRLGGRIVGSWYGYLLGGVLDVAACVAGIFGLGFLMHLLKKYRNRARR